MNKIKKRRMKKKLMQNKIKIMFFIVLSFSFFLGSAYAILNQRLDLGGTVKIGGSQFVCENDITGELVFNTSWGNNDGTQTFNTSLLIRNNGVEDIVGWEIKIKGPSDLEVQSNANITYGDDGVITLTHYDWNGTINSDIEFSLEISFITVETELNLEYVTFNGCLVHGDSAPDIEEPEDPDVELTGLTISPSTYTMNIGDTLALIVTKTPSNASADLVWTSSDSNIVSVTEDGVITGVNVGDATITVTSGTISASIPVTVEEESAPPTTSDVQIVFKNTDNYWQNSDGSYSMNFSITITNNSESTIEKVQFTLVMPDGTTYSLWNSAITTSGNDFTYSNTLASGASETIYGQLVWPSGAAVDNYISPQITNIVATSASESASASSYSLRTVENEISLSDVQIVFNKSGDYWGDASNGYSMNFSINITNNSTSPINSVNFTLDVPTGTTYNIWDGTTTVNNNDFTYSYQIGSGGNITINGQVHYPAGTDINNYLNPSVTNITIN